MMAISWPRSFILLRGEDVRGVSGIGVVAWGVEFPDGVVALRWASDWPTSVVFHDKGIEAVKAVHGHDGRTQIVWHDEGALADFDLYCKANGITPGEAPAAFAAWLHLTTGWDGDVEEVESE